MLDNYKKVTSFFRKNGINNIMVDTDGNFEVLIPLLIEGGINGFWPLEVSAGMDAIKIRKEYGNKLFLIGNIDKRALVFGKNAIEKEVNSKVPILKELGGYIPSLDHLVPPEIPYENFKHYVKILKQYL
jgi:uroporphyrinogen decarboxylase